MFNKLPTKSVLIYGIFPQGFFAQLAKRNVRQVFVPEGRPGLQSLRTSIKSLKKHGIVPTVIADNMPGFLFKHGLVKEVWLSHEVADHKGALCSIGALILAVLGKQHRVPVYTLRMVRKNRLLGKPAELFSFNGTKVAPKNIKAYVPLMEWVDKKYFKRIYD